MLIAPRRPRGGSDAPSPAPERTASAPFVTDAQLREMPAVLLLADRSFGKTDTLRKWSAPGYSRLFEVGRKRGEQGGGGGPYELIHRTAETGFPPRSDDVRDYVLEPACTRHQLHVIDVPGEIIDGTNPSAQRWRQALNEFAPVIHGVVILVTPPTRAPRGRIRDLAQFLQDRSGHRALNPDELAVFDVDQDGANRHLDRCVGFAREQLALPGRSLGGCAIAIQVGFGDLTDFVDDAGFDDYLRATRIVWPTDRAFELTSGAIERRRAAFDEASAAVRRGFPWLAERVPGSAWVGFQANLDRHVRCAREPPAVRAMTLAYLWDRLLEGKVRAEEARERDRVAATEAQRRAEEEKVRAERAAQRAASWRRRAKGLALIAGLVIALSSAGCWVYRSKPTWLRSDWVAARSCSNVRRPSAVDRCECLDVLLRASGRRTAERKDAVNKYRVACGKLDASRPPPQPALAAALVQAELAATLDDPAVFCAARLQAARKAAGASALPRGSPEARWYPATTKGEVAAAAWLLTVVEGTQKRAPGDVVKDLAPSDVAAHPRFAAALQAAAGTGECYRAWLRAREDGGWKRAADRCGQEDVALTREDAEWFAADYPSARGQVRVATAGGPCGRDLLDRITGAQPPSPDALAVVNRVSLAPLDRAPAILKDAAAPSAALRSLLRLLDPREAYPARVELAGALDAPALREILQFLNLRWVEQESGVPRGHAQRPDHRVGILRMAAAVPAARALLDLPPTDDRRSAGAWDAGERLEPEHPRVLRARLALVLLARETSARAVFARSVGTWHVYLGGEREPADAYPLLRNALLPLLPGGSPSVLPREEPAARSCLCQAAADAGQNDHVMEHLKRLATRGAAGGRGRACAAYAALRAVARGDRGQVKRVLAGPSVLSGDEAAAVEAFVAALTSARRDPQERANGIARATAAFGDRSPFAGDPAVKAALDSALRRID